MESKHRTFNCHSHFISVYNPISCEKHYQQYYTLMFNSKHFHIDTQHLSINMVNHVLQKVYLVVR